MTAPSASRVTSCGHRGAGAASRGGPETRLRARRWAVERRPATVDARGGDGLGALRSEPMLPDAMAAAVYQGDGRITVEELPVPSLEPNAVLVRLSHGEICGPALPLVLEQSARRGSVLGHEWAGTVAAAGSAAGRWEPGARVVANPQPGCGTCRAWRRGRPSVRLQG